MRLPSMCVRLAMLGVASSCGSSSPTDPTALTEPLAQNVTITEIAMLQSLKVSIMQGGNAADHSALPIVALRDSVLRVYVQPGNDFKPHALTARARIVTTSPMGSAAQVFKTTAVVAGPSQESDLTTTLNIPIPGIALENGSSVTVVLNDTTGDAPDSKTSYAKWPQDGSLADLGVRAGGEHLRVMIVPVQYNADGSGRLPDTSDAQIELYRRRFYQLYPAAEVDMTVHDPWPWSQVIDGGGGGMGQLLNALGTLRNTDQPTQDTYYYAAFAPTNDMGSFCGGGCITGLSFLGTPLSVGIGFSGGSAPGTAVHEVGHAHGLDHAPACGAGGPDKTFPHAGGFIGTWGYDALNQLMIDPSVTTDIMGYCPPPLWISDYFYSKLFVRARRDNGYYYDMQRSDLPRFSSAEVTPMGDVRISNAALREPWITEGEPRETVWSGGAGGSATSYYFPYDHLPGGVVYVPEGVPAGARVIGLRAGEAETVLVGAGFTR